MDRIRQFSIWAVALSAGLPALGSEPRQSVAGSEVRISFARQVRPILSNHCFKCHGPDVKERQAGLRLDDKQSAQGRLESGKHAITPGNAGQSELLRRVFSTDAEIRMPPPDSNKMLTDDEKRTLRDWIAQGAPWDQHWSFTPPARPRLPAVSDPGWTRNPIDDFVLARLDREGLKPTREAGKATLIRRLTLDLTGLPPTPAELDAFLADTGDGVYERLVDRLLNSPRYGERMALDWLDAARFADTNGYHIDNGRDMTRWRDWVIGAFNRNLGFDRFTIEQLAGDLLPNPTIEQKIASGFHRNHMINFEGGAIPAEYHTAYIVDRVNTTATIWLGLTVACSQCHDHKYDPLSQRDYYRLFAFFNNVPEKGLDGQRGNSPPLLPLPSAAQRRELDRIEASFRRLKEEADKAAAAADAAQARWEQSLGNNPKTAADFPANIRQILVVVAGKRTEKQNGELRSYFRQQLAPGVKQTEAALATLRQAREELERTIPTTMVMQEMPEKRDTYLLIRGEYDKRGEKVAAGVPAALHPLRADAPPDRLGLAEWIIDRNNPLTARVIVNRYWQMFFGIGLVRTVEDFGSQGEPPTHPELLDWLAREFVEPARMVSSGTASASRRDQPAAWNVKELVRLIVTSATYRQSSEVTPALAARDPENRLLARGARFRLQSEFIRDQALAVSGLLDHRVGGHSVSPYQPAGLWEELMARADGAKWTAQSYTQSRGIDLYRRSMYIFWKRTCPPPSQATFDAPDRETCTVRRARTNTPLQALVLWNDPTFVESSRKLAERLVQNSGPSVDERIALAFRLILSRRPTEAELRVLRRAYADQLAFYRDDPAAALLLLGVGEAPRDAALDPAEIAAWSMVASAILNLDESLTKG